MGLEELEVLWNSKADRFNQWVELGLDEIVAFAQEVERESCAKMCEGTYTEGAWGDVCAAAIRMRSDAELRPTADT